MLSLVSSACADPYADLRRESEGRRRRPAGPVDRSCCQGRWELVVLLSAVGVGRIRFDELVCGLAGMKGGSGEPLFVDLWQTGMLEYKDVAHTTVVVCMWWVR